MELESGSKTDDVAAMLEVGLKITAGHQTMSGKDDYLSGQNLGLVVILTGHIVRGSKQLTGKNYLLYFWKIQTVKSENISAACSYKIGCGFFQFFLNTE